MITKSLITTGNNYRIKKVLEKAKKGEKVTIAYIGGSITEGAGSSTNSRCYAYQAYDYFKNTFGSGGGRNIEYVNAGMGGTPSTLGVLRYDRDVTSYGQVQPDLVFVEFAVNDYQEPTAGEAYESLVRKILTAKNQPAVVLLFSVFKSRWNMQDLYKPIGWYYELPMISIKDAVVPELEEENITEDEFFIDEYHPTDLGHEIMADCIQYYFNTVKGEAAAEKDIEIPGPTVIGSSFEDVIMIDNRFNDKKVRIIPGGFHSVDNELCMVNGLRQKTFPNNWMHDTDATMDSFVMTLKCKSLLLVYKSCASEEYGIANVYVDGKKVVQIDSKLGGGWNNPVTLLLFKNGTTEMHSIEVRMAEDSRDKKFTLLAFGFTK